MRTILRIIIKMILERTDRRTFLGGLTSYGAAAALLGTGCGGALAPGRQRTVWVSAQGSVDADPGVVVAGPGVEPLLIPTGFRGHDIAAHPLRADHAVLFGRRPGTAAAVVDVRAGGVHAHLKAPDGMGFQGHGFFTPDGARLMTSEADLTSAAGYLGIWETATYTRLGTLPTFGMEPHEVQVMPDGATVVVAHGGLLTRPESGREVLNLDTMDSNLTYLSLSTGALLEQRRVPEAKASLRHFDIAQDGSVALGMQVQREALEHDAPIPLAAVHRRGTPIQLLKDSRAILPAMQDYVGSVVVSSAARIAGFSSPRGDIVVFWNIDDGRQLGHHELSDCSGLALSSSGDAFVLSSSLGEVRSLSTLDLREDLSLRRRFDEVRWDNHLISINRETLS